MGHAVPAGPSPIQENNHQNHDPPSSVAHGPDGLPTTDPNSDPPPPDPDQGDGSVSEGPIPAVGPASPRGGVTPTNGEDVVFDVGLVGIIEWNDSDDSATESTMESLANVRPFDNEMNLVTSVPSTRMETTIESGTGGWMSYLAAGGWRAGFSELLSAVGDQNRAPDGPSAALSPAASITDGKTPVSILLSTPGVPLQSSSAGLEQIAELSPAEESSSLALVATLWAAPSDSETVSPGWDRPVEGISEGLDRAASLSSLTRFLTGLDLALEESYRDAREDLFSIAASGRWASSKRIHLTTGLEGNGRSSPPPEKCLIWRRDSREPSARRLSTSQSPHWSQKRHRPPV